MANVQMEKYFLTARKYPQSGIPSQWNETKLTAIMNISTERQATFNPRKTVATDFRDCPDIANTPYSESC